MDTTTIIITTVTTTVAAKIAEARDYGRTLGHNRADMFRGIGQADAVKVLGEVRARTLAETCGLEAIGERIPAGELARDLGVSMSRNGDVAAAMHAAFCEAYEPGFYERAGELAERAVAGDVWA
jgi:hypothetical protein